MAPKSEPLSSATAVPPWALPFTAIILVAGSLAFWSCVGLLWVAARPATQQPIVIWMPAANSAADRQTISSQHEPVIVAQDR